MNKTLQELKAMHDAAAAQRKAHEVFSHMITPPPTSAEVRRAQRVTTVTVLVSIFAIVVVMLDLTVWRAY